MDSINKYGIKGKHPLVGWCESGGYLLASGVGILRLRRRIPPPYASKWSPSSHHPTRVFFFITVWVMIIQFQLQPCPLRVQCMSILITQGLDTLRGNIKSRLSCLSFLDADIAHVVDPFQMDDKDPSYTFVKKAVDALRAKKLHMIRQDVSIVFQKYSGLGTTRLMWKFRQWKMLSFNDF